MKSRAGPNCALSVTGGDGLRITKPHQRTLKRYIYGQPRPSRTRSALPSVCTRTEGLRQNHTSIAEPGALSCPPAPLTSGSLWTLLAAPPARRPLF